MIPNIDWDNVTNYILYDYMYINTGAIIHSIYIYIYIRSP